MNPPTRHHRAWLALLLVAPAPTLGVVFGLYLKIQAAWIVAKAWLLLVPLLWRFAVDRKAPTLSLARRGGWKPAIFTGLIAAVAILYGYLLLGIHVINPSLLRETLEPLGLMVPSKFILAALYWIFINSVLEEYVYRWFMVEKCSEVMGGPGAVLVSALVFVAHHTVAMALYFPWWINVIASVAIFVAGAVWSWLYYRYQSVWVPYVSHVLADAGIFIVAGYLLFGA